MQSEPLSPRDPMLSPTVWFMLGKYFCLCDFSRLESLGRAVSRKWILKFLPGGLESLQVKSLVDSYWAHDFLMYK